MRDEISENSSRCGWQLWTNSSLSVRNSRQRKQSAKLSISCAIESRFYWPINQFFFIQNMFIMRRRYFLLPLTAVAAIICTNRAQLINRFYWKSFSGKLKNKMFFLLLQIGTSANKHTDPPVESRTAFKCLFFFSCSSVCVGGPGPISHVGC